MVFPNSERVCVQATLPSLPVLSCILLYVIVVERSVGQSLLVWCLCSVVLRMGLLVDKEQGSY